jgi:zinc D-Ala-D-Ala dipeptidase
MSLSPEAIANRARLAEAMTRHGFVPLTTEWWHFDDRDAKGEPLADVSFETLARQRLPAP